MIAFSAALNLAAASLTNLWLAKRRRPMMRLMLSAIAVVVLVAVATSMLRLPSPTLELSTAAMPSLQELHTMAGVSKLPTQDVEDQSLIYPTVAKH